MKYVRILREKGPAWGVVQEDRVFTLSEAPYEKLSYDGDSEPLSRCSLLAPCEPTKIVCVGKNYYDHVMEMGGQVPETPILFLKGLNCVNRPDGEIHAPDFVKRLDYEGELAFVIRKRAKNVSAQNALEYILGYTCLNDVTARDIQARDGQWTRAKSMDGFAPVGPWITDQLNPEDLKLETRLNGKTVQSTRTSRFMTKIPGLVEFITACITLEAGDVVATGTPSGIGPMVPGDVVEVEVEGIGILRSRVV
jgi:2-keto-4-pentenoate hydratase/2-oxohepta-3-ene-1,7-dioic acid hydratase in catechol pathway